MGAIAGALGNRVEVTNINVTTPTMKNLSMPAKNTEYDYALPSGTKRFKIQNRNDGLLKMAFVSGESSTKYWTIFPGQQDEEISIVSTASITLYLQATKDNQVAEIRSWA